MKRLQCIKRSISGSILLPKMNCDQFQYIGVWDLFICPGWVQFFSPVFHQANQIFYIWWILRDEINLLGMTDIFVRF